MRKREMAGSYKEEKMRRMEGEGKSEPISS